MRQFSRIVLRNSTFGMAAQLAIKILSFGFSVLIVRNLGEEDFGQYAAVLAFGAMFVFMADLGLSSYTVREVARWRDAPDGFERAGALFGNILAVRFLLSLFTAALLITSAWLSGRPSVMIIAIALGTLGLIMYSIHGASDAMLAGFERIDLSSGTRVLYQLVFVLAGAAALLMGAGYYGLIFANLLGIAIMTLLCWRGVRALGVRPRRPTPGIWLELLRTSIPFGLISFALGLSYKFDTVLLNIYHGDAETGYYNAAYTLVFSSVLLSNVINTALYPSLTRQSARDPDSVSQICGRALRYLLIAALPIAAGGSLLADQIIPFLFGDRYIPAVLALRIVIWATPLMFASEFLGYVVLISGRERRAARAVFTSTAINIGCNMLMVPYFGVLGAAIMTVLTELILVGLYIQELRTILRAISWEYTLMRPLLAVAGMVAIVLLIREHIPLLAIVAVGAATYSLLLLVQGVIGQDELRFVRAMRGAKEPSTAQ